MKFTNTDKLIAYLALISGLSISAVAVYYSVAGLVSIFAAAMIPIIVMGVALEVSKLIATVWLKQNWQRAPAFIKTYMTIAVAILMIITSMGIFGFLSKAHSDAGLVSGDVQAKIAVYDEKIKTAKDNIEANRKQLRQMDEAVDQVMARSKDERGANNANAIRRSQQKDRVALAKDTEANQKLIAKLNDEAAPIRAEVRKVEAEVGPIKYIAAFVYGDNPDANVLEKAVTWVIIIIVSVFDPLAVILLLASQYSFQWFRRAEEENVPSTKEVENATTDNDDVLDDNNDKGNINGDDRPDSVVIPNAEPKEPISGDLSSPDRFGLKKEPTITLTMPGTIGAPTTVFPEGNWDPYTGITGTYKPEVESPNAPGLDASNERPGDYLKVAEFAPPGTPGEAWDTPVQADSEQQDNSNLDKIYKASTEELVKQKRSRGWFNAVFPKRDNN
jgi:hypothetical protein